MLEYLFFRYIWIVELLLGNPDELNFLRMIFSKFYWKNSCEYFQILWVKVPKMTIKISQNFTKSNYLAGVLVVVFNYTGDRFNFGMGVEKAKALGLKVNLSQGKLSVKSSGIWECM